MGWRKWSSRIWSVYKTCDLMSKKGDTKYRRYLNIEMTVEINNKSKWGFSKKRSSRWTWPISSRTSTLSLPNQERKADNHFYLLEAMWIDLNLNKDAIVKFGIDYRGGNDWIRYPYQGYMTLFIHGRMLVPFLKVELRIEHR